MTVTNNMTSAKVKQILNAYATRAWKKNIFDDCWTRLLVSAAYYWVEINTGDVVIDDKVFDILKDYIFDMEEEFEPQELKTMYDSDYTNIIEHCCNMFDRDILKNNVALHAQPRELTKFICDILTQNTEHKFKDGSSVYMPFAGYCSEVVCIDDICREKGVTCEIDTDEISDFAWAISMLRLDSHALFTDLCKAKTNIVKGNSYQNLSEVNKRYDYVVFTPPFGVKSENGCNEYEAVRMAIENKLVDGGTVCCILPAAFLAGIGKEGRLREYLLRNGYIDTIVSLPKIFSPYTNINTVLLVARKQYQSKIKLVDGTNFLTPGRKENGGGRLQDRLSTVVRNFTPDYCITVPVEDVLKNDSLLIPQLALSQVVQLSEGERLYQLSDIVSSCSTRPRNLGKDKSRPVKHTIRQLFDVPYNCEVELDSIPYEDSGMYYMPKHGVYHFEIVEGPSWAAQIVGDAIKVGKINEEGSFLVQCKRNTFFFKVNEEQVLPEFLMLQLQSDYVKKQIKAILTKSLVASVNLKDLSNIRVIIPTIEKQKNVIIRDMAKDIYALNIELERKIENLKKDFHTRKHALAQSISALASHWFVINNLRIKNNGVIDCSSKIGIANPMSVESKFNAITHIIESINNAVMHLTDTDYSWGDNVEINISSFIEEYIKKNANHDYMMYLTSSCDNDECIIKAPVRAIERIFLNIVSNAVKHGFTDSCRNDYQIKFDVFEQEGNIVVVVSNNGNPLGEEVTGEMVLTDGFSTALNLGGHQGIGGDEIKTIMSKLGSVEIISNPQDTFPVGYKLTFKNTKISY